MVVPERSLDQRAAALVRANQIRVARKDLKVHLRRDESLALITRLVAANPPDSLLASWKVLDMLAHCHHLGAVRARGLFTAALGRMASPSRTLAGLSDTQRQQLVNRLNAEATRRRTYRQALKRKGHA